MKKTANILTAALLALSLGGCSPAELEFSPNPAVHPAGEELTVWFATDPHYLSPELTDRSEPFLTMVSRGDGKTAHYSPEIVAALLEQAREEQPDVLILGGDLTFNGERQSHQELAEQLTELEAAGVPVLVIPGNHDLNNPMAYCYRGDTAEPAESVTGAEFRQLYANFGYADSITHDESSFSYAYALAEDLWLVAVDANSEEHPGWVKDSTLQWLDETLARAEEEGAAVITFTHQNTLRHNGLFPYGYTILNNQSVQDVLLKHGVGLNLTGHIHLQHIGTLGGLREVTTSSLAIVENHVGRVTIQPDRSAVYETFSADVQGYAQRRGLKDENLLNFSAYSRDYFVRYSLRGVAEGVAGLGLTPEQQEQMAEVAQEMNCLYFTGRLSGTKEELLATPGGILWRQQFRQNRMGEYLEYLAATCVRDENALELAPLWLKGY